VQQDHDKSNPTSRRGSSDQIMSLLAVNGIIVAALVVFALSSPSASEWISAAAQAEFVGDAVPATSPTQIALPAHAVQSARAN
jgi:hypothetical protein